MSTITGEVNTRWFRMRTLLGALQLEIAGFGFRGRSAYSIIKREHGLTGTRQRVYEQFKSIVEASRPDMEAADGNVHC